MISNMCQNNKFKHSHVLISIMLFLFQSVNSSTTSPSFKCTEKEKNALLDFKAGFQEPFGIDYLSTWGAKKRDVDDDCCNWDGVVCNNQTGQVTELQLRGFGLEGEISPSLLNLTYLTHLDLSWNSFNGTIPSFIGSMTQLRYLALDYSNFDGPIPEDIGSLTELRYLDLSGNSFNGTIPESIGSLTELTYLDLSVNDFNETIPGSIGLLTKLEYFDLHGNSFNGSIPMSIGSLTKLTYLDLSQNSFHGSIPMSIGYLTEIRSINLVSNSFSGNIPSEFGNLVNLEELWLYDIGRCSVENISWVSRLSRLGSLRLDGISLAKADHWVNSILSLQNLTLLTLDGCDLSKVMHPYSSSSSLVNSSSPYLSNIVRLSLANNNLNSSMYPWFYPLTRNNTLQALDLSGNKLEEIPKYFGDLCHLTELNFKNNSAFIAFSDFLKTLSVGCTSTTLNDLVASNSQFTGAISDDIQHFTSLQRLLLDHNQLNGTISEKMLELPMLIALDISFNSLRSATFEMVGKSAVTHIDFSNNLLEEFRFKTPISNLNNIGNIDLSSCKLGSRGFPKWIQTFKNLTSLHHLNFANNGISYTIPADFWDTLPSLMNLNLSSNNISGITSYLLNSNRLSVVDLSSNSFSGSITNVSSNLILLNLSRNKFYGGISFLCQNVDWYITYLDLSYNSFSGQIPDCLWHLKALTVLNLAHNNLSGRLPASVEYLAQLEVMYLYNNDFSGELPLSLRNCTKLTFLDLGVNRFSGNVPVWIGESLSGLYVLSLGSNDFFGPIPLQICQLVNLQILDLSMNNLDGTIPSCVNNLTSMVQEGFLSTENVHISSIPTYGRGYDSSEYVDHAMIQWQGIIREFTSNLVLLKSIDLSSNKLTGEIPNELTDLHGLIALNLSNNALLGEIPSAISHMNKLLILDLSRNNFSGEIPSSMSKMSSLYDLDVSYNNLSGKIPLSTQLQSFEASRYIGNAGLCGLPLSKRCRGDIELDVPSSPVGEREGGDQDEVERWFYIGGATGFAIGFWIVCITTLVISRGRRTFFHFMDTLEDQVYVKVSVFKTKFQRTSHP